MAWLAPVLTHHSERTCQHPQGLGELQGQGEHLIPACQVHSQSLSHLQAKTDRGLIRLSGVPLGELGLVILR